MCKCRWSQRYSLLFERKKRKNVQRTLRSNANKNGSSKQTRRNVAWKRFLIDPLINPLTVVDLRRENSLSMILFDVVFSFANLLPIWHRKFTKIYPYF